MKRVAIGIVLGAAAGVIGIIVYELTDLQIAGWLVTGLLLGVSARLPLPAKRRVLWWGVLGAGIILASWLVERIVRYPILIAWPILGAIFGCLAPSRGQGWGSRIGGAAVGLMAGLVGMGIMPLITLVLLPALSLPTTFDFDIDMLGLVVTGIFIGGTTAWLRGAARKNAKKSKRRSKARGKR